MEDIIGQRFLYHIPRCPRTQSRLRMHVCVQVCKCVLLCKTDIELGLGAEEHFFSVAGSTCGSVLLVIPCLHVGTIMASTFYFHFLLLPINEWMNEWMDETNFIQSVLPYWKFGHFCCCYSTTIVPIGLFNFSWRVREGLYSLQIFIDIFIYSLWRFTGFWGKKGLYTEYTFICGARRVEISYGTL